MTRPAGLDHRTALRVRGMVVRGKRVDDPRLRPTAEFYVDRIERTYERMESLRPFHIFLAVAFAALFLGALRDPSLFTIAMGVNALVWTWIALFGPRNRRRMLRRLDVNRPDAGAD